MAYRGDDLDLRTPQNTVLNGDTQADLGRTRAAGYARGPILVDDVVMACCNHAFDVASAHRATEVRIEHLLHAMTRLDGATAALEARGIRVQGLRRESATIIASEIPIGLVVGQTRPRRSEELETLLRQASAIAARRNGAANVDDLVDALLDMPTDIPGISLLARHGGRVVRDRMSYRERDARDPFPLPPLSRSGPATEVRLESDWRRSTVEPQRMLRPEPQRSADLGRDYAGLGTPVDGIQNARIEQLEAAVRALTAELSSERNSVTGVVQDLQRAVLTERDDTSRFRGGLDNRLSALERALLDNRTGDDTVRLIDRIGSLEQSLSQQTAELQRPWAILSDRLQALEQAVLDVRHSGRGADLTPLADRLSSIERAVRDSSVDGSRGQAGIADRLKQIERSVEQFGGKSLDLTPLVNRLDIIEEAVLQPQVSATVDEDLLARLRAMEEALAQQRALLGQATANISSDVKSLAAALAQQSAGSDRMQSLVGERMQALMTGVDRQRNDMMSAIAERIGTLVAALDGRIQAATQPVHERLSAVTTAIDSRMQAIDRLSQLDGRVQTALTATAASIDQRLQATTQPIAEKLTQLDSRIQAALTPLFDRLGRLEQAIAANAQRTNELQTSYAAELKEVHEALLKLNTNQHTLAGSIDQWRLDGVGDISIIANRLEGIEKNAGKPNLLLEQLSTNVDNIGRATVERYHRRNRFWYWLFGTDDWLGASWPSQVAAVEKERQQLRGVPTRTTPAVAPQPQKPLR